MKHFAEVLSERNYNLCDEILTIEELFLSTKPGISLYDNMRSNFLRWRLRSNYIDFDSFFAAMGLSDLVDKCYEHFDITLEEFVFYCEYMLNVLCFDAVRKMQYSTFIEQNITNVLDKFNYTTHISNGIIHIVENNVLVSESANVVQDNYDLGEAIYSFNYRETAGNLNRKADILCRLYKYIEGITPQAKQYGYGTLLDDIKDLSNKLDVRHAPTTKQGIVIGNMDAQEYEDWLDELFKLSLSLIVLVDYTSKRKDVKELKAKLG